MNKRGLLLFFVTAWVFMPSCRKNPDQIPLISVNFYLNINEPSNFNLQVIGGHETYVGGSRGILIYRNSLDEFSAYDRHAPYHVSEGCQVDILEDGIIIEDPCSGSQWIITDGTVIQGPAGANLERYNTSFNDPVLHIYN